MSSYDDDNKDELRQTKGWSKHYDLVLYQGFWCPSLLLQSVADFQSKFKSHHRDIFLTSLPKSGTTWLKALVYSIVHRHNHKTSTTPLLTASPHRLVPFVELAHTNLISLVRKALTSSSSSSSNRSFLFSSLSCFDLASLVSLVKPQFDPKIGNGGGRLWSTHLPYESLPDSVKGSDCQVVYICRNPLDVLVSGWHFGVEYREEYRERWTVEEYVDRFCSGEAHMFGPYWSHVLGYWKASLERPDKVLFVRYEDLKEDAVAQVKRIAEFVGFGFTEEEVTRGVVEEIVELCSLKSLKNLETNKSGDLFPMYENRSFFRKGKVGDWVNLLTPAMAARVNDTVEQKLCGSGLTFQISI